MKNQRRHRCLLLGYVCCVFVNTGLLAGVIHVAPGGQSGAAGTEADPFGSLTEAIAAAAPGDRVEVAAGVYEELVTVDQQGTAAQPIVVRGVMGADGEPASQIHAFERITPGENGYGMWSQHTGSIWKIQVPRSLELGQNLVLQNGEALRPARWPSAIQAVDFDRRRMAEADAGGVDLASKGTQPPYAGDKFYTGWYDDTDLAGFPADHFAGAHVDLCAGYNWWHKSGVVTGNSGNRITFRYRFSADWDHELDTPARKDRYAVWGHLSTLTEPGEFFLDVNGLNGPAGTLYVWLPGGGSPESEVMSVRVREHTLLLNSAAHLHFEHLGVKGGAIMADSNSHDLLFDGMSVWYGAVNRNALFGVDRAVEIHGDNITFANGLVMQTDGWGLYTEGAFTVFRNNVSGVSRLQGLALDSAIDGLFEYNTVFEGGSALVSIGSKRSIIQKNHVYKAGMRITDIALMNTWNSGDMLGTEIRYNWVHTNLAADDEELGWHGGRGIRLDSGGAPLGCSNALVHHNVVWGTTSSSSIVAWFLNEDQLNFEDPNIRVYQNTMDQQLVMSGNTPGPGYDYQRNIAARFRTPEVLGDAVLAQNLFWELNEDNPSENLLDNPRFTSAVTHLYTLEPDSPGLDVGIPIPGITEATGSKYLGAYNPDAEAWVPGARIVDFHLTSLRTEVHTGEDGERSLRVWTPAPGRTFPDDFTVKLGGRVSSGMELMFDFEANRSVAYMEIDLNGLSGVLPVEVSLNGADFVTPDQGTVDVAERSVEVPVGLSGLGSGGGVIEMQTEHLGADNRVRKWMEVRGALNHDFTEVPVPVVVDTRAWMSEGLDTDGGNLRFMFGGGAGELSHWIESGLGTEHTLIWLFAEDVSAELSLYDQFVGVDQAGVYAVFGGEEAGRPQRPDLFLERFPTLQDSSLLAHFAFNRLADVYEDGADVSEVTNAVEGGASALQGESLRQPIYQENKINRLGVISFDGALDYLDVGGAAGLGTGPFHALVLSQSLDPGTDTYPRLLSARKLATDSDLDSGVAVLPEIDNGPGVVYGPDVRKLVRDNIRSRENFRIGARALSDSGFFRGDIGEVFLFGQRVPFHDVQELDAYLERKWGLEGMIEIEENAAGDLPGVRVWVGGVEVQDVTVLPGGEIQFAAPPAPTGVTFPYDVDVEVIAPDGTVYLFPNAYRYVEDEELFVSDYNADGLGEVPELWFSGGELTVEADPALNPVAPHHVASLFIDSTSSVEKDEYVGLGLPETVDLLPGEALTLRFRIRFTGVPNDLTLRTGASFGYRESGLSPWGAVGNREYFFRTSYGAAGTLGNLRSSRDSQFINVGTILADQLPSVDLGTSAAAVWFEMARVSPNRLRLRYQIGDSAVAEVVTAEDLWWKVNQIFWRYRRATNAPLESMHLSEISVTKSMGDRWVEVPPPPGNVVAADVSSTNATIQWDSAGPEALGYVIQRRVSGGLYETVAEVGPDTLSWEDTGLSGNGIYDYRLFTVGAEDYSEPVETGEVATDESTLLVHDTFSDGSTDDNPLDFLDVGWIRTSYQPTVVTDAVLDPVAPSQSSRVHMDGTNNAVEGYLGFRIPGSPVQLGVGEGLNLTYQVRFPQGARQDTSRTGVSFALTAPGRDTPWQHVDNREYVFYTSYGRDEAIGNLRKTEGLQFINASNVPQLLSGGQAKDLGTEPGKVEFEVFRVSEGSVRIRFRFGEEAYDEYVDSASPHTSFSHVYLRYRMPSLESANDWLVDDVRLRFLHAPVAVPEVSPRDLWWDEHFPPNPNGVVAPDWLADADGDTHTNLAEYAFWGDPWVPYSIKAPSLYVSETGDVMLRLNATRPDLTYWLEASPEILEATWLPLPGGSLPSGSDSPVENLLQLDGLTRRFFRVRVSP